MDIYLSYNKIVRIFTAMLLLFITAGYALTIVQIFSRNNAIGFFDYFGIISGLLLLLWFARLFFDSWKTLKVDDSKMEQRMFFLRLSLVFWEDVVGIEKEATNQVNNFVQGEIIALITKNGKKLRIAERYENFGLFYSRFIEGRWTCECIKN